jgi:outer membrane receptor protein involved in Fe transport
MGKVCNASCLFKNIILFFAVMGLFVPSAFAEQAVGSSNVYDLGEVVVSGDREEQETPSTITIVTAEEIEQKNAQNLGEALTFLPGVQFRQSRSKNEFYITMRGFEQQSILILLDGVPIYQPYEGLVNLADIPVHNIAEIKLVKGNVSTLYGPNSMGGIINVITKKGTEKPSLAASYQFADYNTHHLQASHGWKIGKLSYFLGASHKESDGYRLARTFQLSREVLDSMAIAPTNPPTLPNTPIKPDSGRRENSDYDRDSFTFTGSYEINANNSLGLSFEYYDNEYGIPPGPIYRETKKGFFYFPRYWRFTDWERYVVNVTGESRILPELRVKARVFYDSFDSTLNAYDDDRYSTQNRIGGPPSGKSPYDDYSVGGNLYTFWTGIPGNEVRFGFTFKQDIHRESFNDGPEDRLVSDTYSIALEDEVQLTKELTAVAGVSYDIFDKRKREQEGKPSYAGSDIYTLNPMAGLTYQHSDTLKFFGSAGKKVRFPTMRNLYASGVIGPIGDPDLDEEQSYNYELGTIWMAAETVSIEASLFYSEIKDLINFDNQIGRFEQYDKVTLAGAELALASQLTPSLYGRIAYSFLDAQNHSTVTVKNEFHPSLVYEPEELPYRPEHKIDLDLSQIFSFGLRVNLNTSYVSERTYYNHADPQNNKTLVAEQEDLSDYFLLNLKLSQKILKNYYLYVFAQNLLDEVYQDLFQFASPGRTIWAGVKVEI